MFTLVSLPDLVIVLELLRAHVQSNAITAIISSIVQTVKDILRMKMGV